MADEAVESQVRAILSEVSQGREVPDRDEPLTDLGFDSLTKVEAIARIEQGFGIRFGEADISGTNFNTLGTIVQLVQRRLP
ncbi:acyl carrier protein [Solwaraspora sp. WMMD1047]|uniref:acyl carrier protein n=1 Tax=Solwaraspora sp. WMMD1047 TaxID=3016102 RepID=UPI002416CF0C|nr:acyl carrier protein [Solwaraspora sp. WMMD1047]MDG4829594.1 acyl carrier protein [Solwaraspora sp. WMMD1047]